MTVLHKYLPLDPSESVGGEGFLTFALGLFFELTQVLEEARELDVTGSEHVAGYEIRPYLRLASGSR